AITAVTAVTTAPPAPATPGYHDMLRVNDQQFKEDSTSYLRVAFLMDRFGLDTKLYRQEIIKVLPRLNTQMKYRGSDQRMAFHLYYKHFGLEEPFPLQAAYQTGVISSRHTPAWFKQNKMEMYNLTHEIFVPYEFGEKLDVDFFSEPDKAYLRPLLADLTAYGIGLDDADITAELTSCLRYLHFTSLPVYQESLQYLLKSQRPDGKWGNYERHRGFYGDYVNQAFYLHTTLVVVDATRLERNLNLVLQVLEITDRAVVCVNLMDEARRHGFKVDDRQLARDLGVPVVPTAARQGEGLPELLRTISEVASGRVFCRPQRLEKEPPALKAALGELVSKLQVVFPGLPNARWVAMRLLGGDDRIIEALRKGELRELFNAPSAVSTGREPLPGGVSEPPVPVEIS
ncbi:MAG: FeoB small GTPase domain-containing protein, partial [bacterium]